MRMAIVRPLIALLLVAGWAAAQYGDISDLKLAKPEDKKDVKSTPPPKDALVLFDGKSLDGWERRDGKGPAPWKILETGAMQVQDSDIVTKQKFDGDFKL